MTNLSSARPPTNPLPPRCFFCTRAHTFHFSCFYFHSCRSRASPSSPVTNCLPKPAAHNSTHRRPTRLLIYARTLQPTWLHVLLLLLHSITVAASRFACGSVVASCAAVARLNWDYYYLDVRPFTYSPISLDSAQLYSVCAHLFTQENEICSTVLQYDILALEIVLLLLLLLRRLQSQSPVVRSRADGI